MYGITIDKTSRLSATKQLCMQLRVLIETGELAAGTRLLPTRVMAKEWGIARNVVIEVYEQLAAEGYLDSKVGSGTYVAEGILFSAREINPPSNGEEPKPANTEQNQSSHWDWIDFATGIPDLETFPGALWAKYVRDAAETVAGEEPGYGDIRGDWDLRCAIRDYVFRTKGIRCSAEQIMICSGASEGLVLTAFSLSRRFHSIYIEDPTIEFTRNIFEQSNYRLVPVEVDRHGMNMDAYSGMAPGHLVLLTPSHQFPSGSILSIQRRQRMIRLAEEADSYLIEDDYDSEFRLRGIPVPPLQTLSPSRVIYVGTFSKTLLPSLRIGFLIVPPGLTDIIVDKKAKLGMCTPLLIQKALSRFIQDGQLDRHIHTMKKEYRKRRLLLKERLHDLFGEEISILGDEAGMHLLVRFHSERHSRLSWGDTASYGFQVERTVDYKWSEGPCEADIVLGYGNLNVAGIEEGVRRMSRFVAESASAN